MMRRLVLRTNFVNLGYSVIVLAGPAPPGRAPDHSCRRDPAAMPPFLSGRQPVSALLCLVSAFILVTVSACGKGDGAPAAQAQHGGGPGGGQRPEQAAVPVAAEAATVGTIASYYKATATLEAEKEAEVLARVTGLVQRLHAEEGDLVKEGAPLLTIDNDEYRFRVEQAEATAANLRSRYERLEQMMAGAAGHRGGVPGRKSDLASAEADEGLARLNLSYTSVRAPFTGRVTRRLVDVGQNLSTRRPGLRPGRLRSPAGPGPRAQPRVQQAAAGPGRGPGPRQHGRAPGRAHHADQPGHRSDQRHHQDHHRGARLPGRHPARRLRPGADRHRAAGRRDPGAAGRGADGQGRDRGLRGRRRPPSSPRPSAASSRSASPTTTTPRSSPAWPRARWWSPGPALAEARRRP